MTGRGGGGGGGQRKAERSKGNEGQKKTPKHLAMTTGKDITYTCHNLHKDIKNI